MGARCRSRRIRLNWQPVSALSPSAFSSCGRVYIKAFFWRLRSPHASDDKCAQRLREPDGRQIMSVLADVEPPPLFPPRINGRYPSDMPRASTPAALLELLPPLPVVLSYRFVGRDLLLLDRNTGVILDFVDDALPPG